MTQTEMNIPIAINFPMTRRPVYPRPQMGTNSHLICRNCTIDITTPKIKIQKSKNHVK